MNIQEMLKRLSPLMASYLAEPYFSGAVVGIQQNGHRVSKAWGTAIANGEKLTTSHFFDLASVTKLYTTMAVLRLIENKNFSEHTKLIDILHFEQGIVKEMLSKVDIASLLTHHSGLPAWYPFYTRRNDSFETILHDVLVANPLHTEVVYSDLNFMLLGKVVSTTMKQPLDEAMQRLVLDPLHLKSTTYHPDPNRCVATEYGNQIEEKMVRDRVLSFNGWRDKRIPIRGACDDGNGYYYFHGVSGHAGLFSTGTDVLAFGNAFLKPENAGISQALYDTVVRNWGGNRGYGIQHGDLYPKGGFGHTGFTGTYLYVNPERDVVITILTNRLHVPVVHSINALRLEIVDQLLEWL